MTALLRALARQRRVIGVLLAALVAGGVAAAVRLPASILPEVAFPRLTILADAGEQPADEMVRAVTRPIEEALRRVPEIREVRSTTSRGSCEIQLDCAWGSPMASVLQRVQARLETVRPALPAGTTLDARLMSPALFPVLGFALTSRTLSPLALRDLADFTLKPELQRLPGVADVVVQGGARPEARVELDPGALAARRLGVARVAQAITDAEALPSAGLLDANGQLYLTLANARPAALDALAALPVPVDGGPPAPLGTLARVSVAPQPEFTRYVAGGGPAVLVNLLRQPTASMLALSRAAHEWFRAHRRELPPDLEVETFYDQADLVHDSVGSVRDSLIAGAVMAVLILALLLGSARLGFAGALVLPLAIAATLVGLAAAGQSLNLMTLGGIAAAVGLVLDDAIVALEHVAHRAAAGVGALEALAEIAPSLAGSTLCTTAIFVPFAWLTGVTGAFFRVLALAMVLMLASSFALCVALVPWLAAGARAPRPAPPAARRGFERVLGAAVARPALGWLVVAAVAAAVVPLRAGLGSGFLPEMDEGSLILDYAAPPGFSVDETDRMLRHVEDEIAHTPEIVAWSRRTGDQLGFFITEPNTGDYVLRLARGRRRSADDVSDDLRRRVLTAEPALRIEFGQLIEDAVGDMVASAEPIEVRLYGEDRPLLEQRAHEAAALLDSVRGVVDVFDGVTVSGPNLEVIPGDGARRAGLGPEDLADRVAPYLQGVPAGQIARGARAWPVRLVLRGSPLAGAASPRDLLRAGVEVAPGRWAPLGTLADVRVRPGETEITRDDARTMVAVTARLSGRDLGSAMRDVQRRIASRLPLASGMRVRYAGLYAEQQSSFRSLAGVLGGAAIAVLLVLLAAFRSWRVALAALAVAAASLAGVFALLLASGATFNIASFVGAIMVVGITSENAYFLIAAWRDAAAAGAGDARAAAAAAAARRARPVLMTTAAGIAALLPLALGLGSGAELLKPLAIAVIGGFLAAAPLLLLALPALLAGVSAREARG